MVLTSLSTELESRYHYSVMHVGLIYLPQGIACIAGSLVVGNLWIGITDTERQYMTKKLNVYHWTKDHNLISCYSINPKCCSCLVNDHWIGDIWLVHSI